MGGGSSTLGGVAGAARLHALRFVLAGLVLVAGSGSAIGLQRVLTAASGSDPHAAGHGADRHALLPNATSRGPRLAVRDERPRPRLTGHWTAAAAGAVALVSWAAAGTLAGRPAPGPIGRWWFGRACWRGPPASVRA